MYRPVRRRNFTWAHHHVAVIGGDGGIGSEVCYQLQNTGAKVHSLDLSSCFDVTDAGHVHDWFAEHPETDTVIYAAGIAASGLLTRPDGATQLRDVIEVNTAGLLTVASAAAESLRRHRGRLVVLNSAFSLITAPGYGSYSASKAALSITVTALRQELAPATITNCILGGVDTPIFDRAADRAGTQEARDVADRFRRRIARNRPEDVATGVLVAAAHRRTRATVGPDAALIAAAQRIAPGLTQRLIDRVIGNPFTTPTAPLRRVPGGPEEGTDDRRHR